MPEDVLVVVVSLVIVLVEVELGLVTEVVEDEKLVDVDVLVLD